MNEVVLGLVAFSGVSSLVLLVCVLLGRKGQLAVVEGTLPTTADMSRQKRMPAVSASLVEEDNDRLRQLGDRLIQAGLYRRNSIGFYVAMKTMLIIVPAVGWLLAAQAGFITFKISLVYCLMTAIVGTIVPSFWLDFKKKRRQTELRRALPDAVDVIVICVEAGLSLPAALTRVSVELQTAHPMLAAELTIVQREIQMGCTTGEALKRMADRFDVEEVRSLASVVEQAERYGASIVQALRVHADSLRQKRYQQAEERAQQAAVKLLIPTVLFIFPALFVVLLGPAAFDILQMLLEMKERMGRL